MRQLKDYSFEDNISYLKNEHKDMYEWLNNIVSASALQYHAIQEYVDSRGEFGQFLYAFKSKIPAGIEMRFGKEYAINLGKTKNLKELANIFEEMFLSKLDRYDISKLDPEIRELYLEAQEIIDKESQNESE